MKSLFFYLFIYLLCSTQQSSKKKKFILEMYMESMCEGTRDYMKNVITPFIEMNEWHKLVEIYLYPWGSTKVKIEKGEYVFTCNHSQEECVGNFLITCINHMYTYKKALELIVCVEHHFKESFVEALTKCVPNERVLKDIKACVQNKKTARWFYNYKVRTDALKPKLEWVPWTILDGQPDVKIFVSDDLGLYLCKKLEQPMDYKVCIETKNKLMEQAQKSKKKKKKDKDDRRLFESELTYLE